MNQKFSVKCAEYLGNRYKVLENYGGEVIMEGVGSYQLSPFNPDGWSRCGYWNPHDDINQLVMVIDKVGTKKFTSYLTSIRHSKYIKEHNLKEIMRYFVNKELEIDA